MSNSARRSRTVTKRKAERLEAEYRRRILASLLRLSRYWWSRSS